jgi:glycosyltransferase
MIPTIQFIIPSYNDIRILETIRSIKVFDDINSTGVIVIDGGSNSDILNAIKKILDQQDILISEKDKGIFDALNKGLRTSSSEIISWIGSDDLITPYIKASHVRQQLAYSDILLFDTELINDKNRVVRRTPSYPSKHRFLRSFINVPHFSSFGKRYLFIKEEFDVNLRGADIKYFYDLLTIHKPKIKTSSKVGTYQRLGGFSNSSIFGMLKTYSELISFFRERTNLIVAYCCIFLKVSFKITNVIFYYIFRKKVSM